MAFRWGHILNDTQTAADTFSGVVNRETDSRKPTDWRSTDPEYINLATPVRLRDEFQDFASA